MILVRVNTGRFEFEAVGNDYDHAADLLRLAYAKHYEQVRGNAEPDLMSEILSEGEAETIILTPGAVYRDGENLIAADADDAGEPIITAPHRTLGADALESMQTVELPDGVGNPENNRHVRFPDVWGDKVFRVIDGELGAYEVVETGGTLQINHDATRWEYVR